MDFASSGYAKDFFQSQVPQIIRSLKSIADSQQKLVELQMQQNSNVDKPLDNPTAPTEVTAEGTIYCATKKTLLRCMPTQETLTICL